MARRPGVLHLGLQPTKPHRILLVDDRCHEARESIGKLK